MDRSRIQNLLIPALRNAAYTNMGLAAIFTTIARHHGFDHENPSKHHMSFGFSEDTSMPGWFWAGQYLLLNTYLLATKPSHEILAQELESMIVNRVYITERLVPAVCRADLMTEGELLLIMTDQVYQDQGMFDTPKIDLIPGTRTPRRPEMWASVADFYGINWTRVYTMSQGSKSDILRELKRITRYPGMTIDTSSSMTRTTSKGHLFV